MQDNAVALNRKENGRWREISISQRQNDSHTDVITGGTSPIIRRGRRTGRLHASDPHRHPHDLFRAGPEAFCHNGRCAVKALAGLSVRRPITTINVLVSLLVLGVISIWRLPLAFLPEVGFPGMLEEAVDRRKLAQRLDPRSPVIQVAVARDLYMAHRYSRTFESMNSGRTTSFSAKRRRPSNAWKKPTSSMPAGWIR